VVEQSRIYFVRASPRVFKTHSNLDFLLRMKKTYLQQLLISTPNLSVLEKIDPITLKYMHVYPVGPEVEIHGGRKGQRTDFSM